MLTQRHDDTAVKAVGSDEPIRFRAGTLEEAVELAEKSLGARTRVIAANQLRRGGIGGFFASDLGVEISVVVEEETVEEALARIVDGAAAEERELWRDRTDTLAISPVHATHAGHATHAAHAALDFDAAQDFQAVDDFLATDPVHGVHAAQSAHALSAMPSSRFEEALRSFEAETSAMETKLVSEFRPYLPTRAQRVSRHSAPVAVSRHSVPVAEPASAPVLTPETIERIEAAYASLQPTAPTIAAPQPSMDEVAAQAVSSAAVAVAVAEASPMSGKAPGPSRRQTELVVAATEQLIDTIASRGTAAQYSVRVVMRGSHGVELEAFASFDTRAAGDES
jgi:hypothetical protein